MCAKLWCFRNDEDVENSRCYSASVVAEGTACKNDNESVIFFS